MLALARQAPLRERQGAAELLVRGLSSVRWDLLVDLSDASSGTFEASWGPFRGLLGPVLGLLGASLGFLGPAWGLMEALWGLLGAS